MKNAVDVLIPASFEDLGKAVLHNPEMEVFRGDLAAHI